MLCYCMHTEKEMAETLKLTHVTYLGSIFLKHDACPLTMQTWGYQFMF